MISLISAMDENGLIGRQGPPMAHKEEYERYLKTVE